MNTAGSRSHIRQETSPHGDRIQGQDSSPLQKGEGIFLRTKSELSKEDQQCGKCIHFLEYG